MTSKDETTGPESNRQVSAVIADDHDIVRDGLKSMLSKEKDIFVIGEASRYEELERILKTTNPDVVILDVSLPGKSGIEIADILSKEKPEIRILMLSMHADEEFVIKSLKAGANGYLPKNAGKSELVSAVKEVAAGGEYVSPSLSKILLKSYFKKMKDDSGEPKSIKFTVRESEILKLFAEGLSNSEIAENLCISVRTVESHKNRVMRKVGARNTIELLKYLIKTKYVEL